MKNKNLKRKFPQEDDKRQHSNKKEKKGSIVNTTGKNCSFQEGWKKGIAQTSWALISLVCMVKIVNFYMQSFRLDSKGMMPQSSKSTSI